MEPDIAALVQPYHAVITLPVQWGEQDAFQHVNHAVYFRWFESARIAYWDRVGWWGVMGPSRVGPIVASVACDYRRQLTHPDTVHVGSRVVRLGRTSFAMEQVVVSSAQRALAAEGRSTIVVFDYAASAPTPIPLNLRRALEELQGHTFGPADQAEAP
jgi:acyl-CoA thioester hydrolase